MSAFDPKRTLAALVKTNCDDITEPLRAGDRACNFPPGQFVGREFFDSMNT
jgi:hypothetical protein